MRKRPLPEVLPIPPKAGKSARSRPPVVVDQLLTISEAAARLGIGRTKMYELINTNQLPYVEIPSAGDRVNKRISALTLNAWMKDRETVKHVS